MLLAKAQAVALSCPDVALLTEAVRSLWGRQATLRAVAPGAGILEAEFGLVGSVLAVGSPVADPRGVYAVALVLAQKLALAPVAVATGWKRWNGS